MGATPQQIEEAGLDIEFISEVATGAADRPNAGQPAGTVTNRKGITSRTVAKVIADQVVQEQAAGDSADLAQQAKLGAEEAAALVQDAAEFLASLGATFAYDPDSPYAASIVRASDKGVLLGLDADGLHGGHFFGLTFNGVDPAQIGKPLPVLPARIIAPIVFDVWTGQSNSNGNSQEIAITNVAPYDCIGFPWQSTNPANALPLTVANTQATEPGHPRGESFMYSGSRRTIEILIERHGKTAENKAYQVLAVNNGLSSQPIEYFNKNSAHWNFVASQMDSAKTLFGGNVYMGTMFRDQGEQGSSGYKATLKQQAFDYDELARSKFGSGQPAFKQFVMQTSTSVDKSIAVAQWQAAKESALIALIGPAFPYTYGPNASGIHRDALGQVAAGGMAAEARAYEEIRGLPWLDLSPEISIQGRVITARFPPLIRPDGTLTDIDFFDSQNSVPQVNAHYGIDLVDVNTNTLGWSVPVKVGPNTLQWVADALPPAGARVVSGYATSINRTDSYAGFAVNLCDNYGEGRPTVGGALMNRHCTFFDILLPAQG